MTRKKSNSRFRGLLMTAGLITIQAFYTHAQIVPPTTGIHNQKPLGTKAATSPGSARKTKKQSLTIKGRSFSIQKVQSVSAPNIAPLAKPTLFKKREYPVLGMPLLKAGPPPAALLPPWKPEKIQLNPIPRWTLVPTWSGIKDQRINPATTWALPPVTPVEITAREINALSDEEYKILQSLVLLNTTETTPVAIGLANPLLSRAQVKAAALEILARGFKSLSVRQASLSRYDELLKIENTGTRAKRSLVDAISLLQPSDSELSEKWSTLIDKLGISNIDTKALPLSVARSALNKKELQAAWTILDRVPEKSEYQPEAEFLRAMILYRSNNINEAREKLTQLLKSEKGSKDLRSLSASTLAQIQFQKGDFKGAFETYRWVDSSHPLWLESLVESAWSQILNKDYEGAAGNMFSLHTSYFKNAYQPESYIVRTVSYLQLCQYGDAQSVLNDFLRKYKFAQKQLVDYKATKPDHLKVVRDFLKEGSPKSWAGLPRSLLIEIARDPIFLSSQRELNEYEDNASQLQRMSQTLSQLDELYLKNINQLKKSLDNLQSHLASKAKNDVNLESLAAEKKNIERHIYRNTLLRRIIGEATIGFQKEMAYYGPLWATQKERLKKNQSRALAQSFDKLEKDLSHWLDQSELLFYEIHSGAGEHIRYQMATNDDTNTNQKQATQRDISSAAKDQKWSFDGEIWEDEVGHYRSSLKNACPANE